MDATQCDKPTFPKVTWENVADRSPATPSFLKWLNEEERTLLTTQFPVRTYPEGNIVCREHELDETLYIVQQGRVAVLKEKGDATFLLLAYRGVGETVGEMAIVAHRPRSAWVVTVEDSELIEITGQDFREIMHSHPTITMAILNVLSNRLNAADEARANAAQESIVLARKAEALTTETEHLHTLTELRQDTVDMIVHDLRNPLTIVKTSLSLLETALIQHNLESEMEIMRLAQRSTDRLLDMASSLLEAARQEGTRIALHRTTGDLRSLLRASVEALTATASEHDLSLRLSLADALPSLDYDPDKLQRVVMNLLDNAISYTPDGGSILLSADTTANEVRVHVTDTGPGVPPAYRDVIFDRFAGVPDAKGRKKGFGLGLYFCRQIIEAHGGRIWVEPGPDGVGSRFSFTLPRA